MAKPDREAVEQAMVEALSSDDRATALKALRIRLAAEMLGASGRDLAALAHQHRMVVAEIATLAAPKERSAVDEIAERRARRKAGATGT